LPVGAFLGRPRRRFGAGDDGEDDDDDMLVQRLVMTLDRAERA